MKKLDVLEKQFVEDFFVPSIATMVGCLLFGRGISPTDSTAKNEMIDILCEHITKCIAGW